MKNFAAIATALFAWLLPFSALALPDTRITIQGTNVTLTWPSASGQTFLVQYRTNLDNATPWTTLTNGLAAVTGTNRTGFTHKGAATFIACPAPAAAGEAEDCQALQRRRQTLLSPPMLPPNLRCAQACRFNTSPKDTTRPRRLHPCPGTWLLPLLPHPHRRLPPAPL